MSQRGLAVLLACFPEPKKAGMARHTLGGGPGPHDDEFLDEVVFKVNGKHRASVHDPRRVWLGTLTPALTWGLFGLVANGWVGLLIWGVVGAACGGPFTYYALHHASKGELEHIGHGLPADSSALLSFVETEEPQRLLAAVADQSAAVASVAAIDDDLGVRVLPESTSKAGQTLASMIVSRYPSTDAAAKAAAKLGGDKKLAEKNQVELVLTTDADGRRHAADPKFGVGAMVRSDIVTWGVFGVVVGAIAGAAGGGALEGGVVTGIAWAVFGVLAGSLYGRWVGTAVSGRSLKGIGALLAPGTSAVLAWADGPASAPALEALAAPGVEQLVLDFATADGGAVIRPANDSVRITPPEPSRS